MSERITPLVPRVMLGTALLLLAAVSILATPAISSADGVPAKLRVVTWKGKVVFDGKASARTSSIAPDAGCLSGSAGPARTIEGPKAVNLLADAAARSRALQPLKISDGDWGFGICGLGGIAVQGKEWWEIRTNYRSAPLGIESLDVKKGDRILLYLNRSWEMANPEALIIKAPAKVKKGKKVRVRVLSVSPTTGKRKPVQGARVRGAGKRTNARGYTRIKVKRAVNTIARKKGLIVSNRSRIALR